MDTSRDQLRFDAAGDRAELDRLTRRYAHRVAFFAGRIRRRFGIDACWHDDLESAGYWGLLQALRRRRTDAAPRELSAYVSTRIEGAIFDEARTLLRKRQRAKEPWEGEAGTSVRGELEPVPPEGPEQAVERARRQRLVHRALLQLRSADQRILLDYAQGESLAEIARREKISPSVIQQRVARATRQLRARASGLRGVLESAPPGP